MHAPARTAFLAILSFLFFLPATAPAAETLSIDRLTRSAGVIVEGRVAAVHSEWTPERTKIYTTVTLDVSSVYKGNVPGARMEVRLLGGTVGDITMAIVGQPGFEVDEPVFLFLRPNHEVHDHPLVGMGAGKFRIAADPSGVETLRGEAVSVPKGDAVRTIRAIPQPAGQ